MIVELGSLYLLLFGLFVGFGKIWIIDACNVDDSVIVIVLEAFVYID
jgi:hypothetical protein